MPDGANLAWAADDAGAAAREIRQWLIARIAASLQIAASAIDPRRPLAALGPDSLQLMSLIGEAEDFVGCTLPDDLISESTSIDDLVVYLVEAKDGRRRSR